MTGDSINATQKEKYFTNQKQGLNYIGTKDIQNDTSINYENGVKITNNFIENFKIANINSTLLCLEGGNAGRKIGFLEQNVCYGNKLCNFESIFPNSKFIFYFLQSMYFFNLFMENLVGIIGGTSKEKIKTFLIPLPPLKEQEKIVKILDELFTLKKALRVE
ncbi:restriction endonuclease subunit S [Campylobacter sp. LR196d]|nr:restriction endonuclease subunit S [Campylobacter sp. LR196d]